MLIQPVHVLVFDLHLNRIFPGVSANSGQPVNPESFAKYNSIAKLFDVVEDPIAQNAYRISVTYHPILGYPTQISIDYDKYVADEEIYLTIENLEARQR
jgi:hypothetical protein